MGTQPRPHPGPLPVLTTVAPTTAASTAASPTPGVRRRARRAAHPDGGPVITPPPEIIAHRGYSAAAPENTLAALDAALEAGAHAVEFDVRVLACGTPVLFHDDTLERTTDQVGEVDTRTRESLAKADAGAWFSPRFRGEPVPTLEAAVGRLAGRVGHIYPEIKAYRNGEDLARIAGIVRDAGMSGCTTFISMKWEALEHLRREDGAARIGYIVERPERFGEALERASGDPRALLDPDRRILLERPEWAAAAREASVALAVWTVNAPEEADRLRELGVGGFTTDEVERLLGWSRQRGPEAEA